MSNETIIFSVQTCEQTLTAAIAERNSAMGTVEPIDQVAYQEATDKTLALVDTMNAFLTELGVENSGVMPATLPDPIPAP